MATSKGTEMNPEWSQGPLILTPDDGEVSRLSGVPTNDIADVGELVPLPHTIGTVSPGNVIFAEFARDRGTGPRAAGA